MHVSAATAVVYTVSYVPMKLYDMIYDMIQYRQLALQQSFCTLPGITRTVAA